MTCPFCPPPSAEIFYEDETVVCIWDGFPVSKGHALAITKRHIPTWFDATETERDALLAGVETARLLIESRHKPDGYNIGVNIGEAAGQTVPHLHVHIIPRYRGDVPDPRGGVRHVIPGKGNYLRGDLEVRDAASEPGALARAVHGNAEHPLLDAMARDMADASRFDLAVAFVTDSGLDQIEPFILDFFGRNGQMRLLTGDYLDVTEPRALRRMLDWIEEYDGQCGIRVFQTAAGIGFHPKAYILHRGDAGATAYIGSSNLTRHALRRGLEWNQRLDGAHSDRQIVAIGEEFDRLFAHPRTRSLDRAWIDGYEKRRTPTTPSLRTQGVDPEEEQPKAPPEPHGVQNEALQALKETRDAGNRAGLVVMATGLGKTWLAAFDSTTFERVLFVAHREEILHQALRTFRRIRPHVELGLYMGAQRDSSADILFASVQTLSRNSHLRHFSPNQFDYVVIDEFHHASAATYRRLIDHFDPQFLLGLTATPERTDGGDLLALCGENLVYRCDLLDGIRRMLLSPFQYFGVPDEVDFSDIPWRSGRFDPERLEMAVATERRAQNAFEQWSKRHQSRALGFCVSQRHADFMAEFFAQRGVRCVAVHSGPSSAPRVGSLQQLEHGDLDIVFVVDMFNEGIDVPAIDTVLMLRPTESKVLWLQQFGRGLRRAEHKDHLTVVDYIGNHKTFLQVPAILLGAGSRPGEVAQALRMLAEGMLELPAGCSVEYELEALNILESLARPTQGADQARQWYRSFRELHGRRPLASEAYHEGYDPKHFRTSYGSWLAFVQMEGNLDETEQAAFQQHRAFLESLEVTAMTRSFKMVVLLAMMAHERFPGSIGIEALAGEVVRIAQRMRPLQDEFGDALSSIEAMRAMLERNPIDAWVGGLGTGGVSYFRYEGGVFSTTFDADSAAAPALQDLAREICDWRVAQYLDRSSGSEPSTIICRVSRAGTQPMLFLPNRDRNPNLPQGWTPVVVGDEQFEANFVKVAVNVLRRQGSEANVLPEILVKFFGDSVGEPGTHQQVRFRRSNGAYELEPLRQEQRAVRWREYMRADIPPLWGLEFGQSKWNQGFVQVPGHLFLLVSLEKQGLADQHQYKDHFLSPSLFQWVSQNRTKQNSAAGRKIRNHQEQNISVHLFVRRQRKTPSGTAAPFTYCGELSFVSWDGDQPITVQWELPEALPSSLQARFLSDEDR